LNYGKTGRKYLEIPKIPGVSSVSYSFFLLINPLKYADSGGQMSRDSDKTKAHGDGGERSVLDDPQDMELS